MSELDTSPQYLAQHFTIRQLASAWHLSFELTRQLFQDEEGVLRITHRLRPGTRGYVSYRVPQDVAARVYSRLTARSRGVSATTGKRADLLQIGSRKGVG